MHDGISERTLAVESSLLGSYAALVSENSLQIRRKAVPSSSGTGTPKANV
jgi:hypothetical protein